MKLVFAAFFLMCLFSACDKDTKANCYTCKVTRLNPTFNVKDTQVCTNNIDTVVFYDNGAQAQWNCTK